MPVAEKTAPANEWPDPLEMAGFKDDEPASASAPPEKPVAETESEPQAKSPEEPLASPFLPDAKVEKRPLGSQAPVAEEAASEAAKTNNSPQEETPKTDDAPQADTQLPAAADAKLPAELQSDLMAVEADTHNGMPKTEEVQPMAPVAEEKPVPAPSQSAAPAPASVPAPGAASIPQQYREEPSSGEKEHSAIYDTDAYHQPLAHPAKKKSGWLWVVWIVLILLVGAGIGAALYYLGVV